MSATATLHTVADTRSTLAEWVATAADELDDDWLEFLASAGPADGDAFVCEAGSRWHHAPVPLSV